MNNNAVSTYFFRSIFSGALLRELEVRTLSLSSAIPTLNLRFIQLLLSTNKD